MAEGKWKMANETGRAAMSDIGARAGFCLFPFSLRAGRSNVLLMEGEPDNPRHWRPWQFVLAGLAILVVSILLLLVGYVALGFDKPDGDQRRGRAQADMNQLVTALNMCFMENERMYPASLEPIRHVYNGRLPQDPYTKADYIYTRTMEGFELRCLGRDGAAGGTGPDKDIVFTEEGERRGR